LVAELLVAASLSLLRVACNVDTRGGIAALERAHCLLPALLVLFRMVDIYVISAGSTSPANSGKPSRLSVAKTTPHGASLARSAAATTRGIASL